MHSILLLFFIVSLPALSATQITTQIHEVDLGSQVGDEVLVLLKSGDVARLKSWNLEMVENLQSSKSMDRSLTFTLDDDRFISSVEEAVVPDAPISEIEKAEAMDYVPTTIANMSTARAYMAESRRTTKELTQCFNRAMI